VKRRVLEIEIFEGPEDKFSFRIGNGFYHIQTKKQECIDQAIKRLNEIMKNKRFI
jgi:hypothetical protein